MNRQTPSFFGTVYDQFLVFVTYLRITVMAGMLLKNVKTISTNIMARKYPIALQDWSQPPSYATVILEGKQLQFVYTLNKSTFIH